MTLSTIIVIALCVWLIIFYLGSTILYLARVRKWNDEREVIFGRLFQCADAMTTIPQGHKSALGMANAITQQAMTQIMLEQEDARRVYQQELRGVVNQLRAWEGTHPVPSKPRWIYE